MATTNSDLQTWLEGHQPERVGRKTTAVLSVIASQPARASYGTAQEMALLASVNIATVTRTAQALGFRGWSEFQRELRAVYLSRLSAPEVAQQHATLGRPAAGSLQQDRENLMLLSRSDGAATMRAAAALVAGARRTWVVAEGSFAAVALAMTHNARLAGYEVESVLEGGVGIANRLSQTTRDDTVVVISLWRLYQGSVHAAKEAQKRGAKVVVVTDVASPVLRDVADVLVTVPAEGVAFFPSLTCSMAAVQAIISELAAIDTERTRASVQAAEDEWREFSLLHHDAQPGTQGWRHSRTV